ncbi:MAG TPA: hypothetical protein VF583_19380 [Bradyrhizobium sp.]
MHLPALVVGIVLGYFALRDLDRHAVEIVMAVVTLAFTATPSRSLWLLMALCVPAVPVGVWAGWRLHERLDQRALYRLCYAILVVTAAKLLWDGLAGYVQL